MPPTPPAPDRPEDDPLLRGLTDQQRIAVTTTEGPLLVLAAAGSGKTRVITRRVAHLLAMGIPAWQIMALTFTNKAAGEMRERVTSLLRERPDADRVARGLTISTFHALCARLLRRYAGVLEGAPGWIKPDYTIYDTSDQNALLKKILKDLELSSNNWSPRTVASTISAAKNDLKDARAYASDASDFYEKTIARVYDRYEAGLRAANAVDFDDLLLLTVRLLRESDEAREEVQARWRYLMIDEYQDTNHVQLVLSTLIVGRDEGEPVNVCAVGDPDQSIYGWRGADISNILDFERTYPGAAIVPLGQNFRSTAPILHAADTLIRNNQKRRHKDLFTTTEGGELPLVVHCRDERHEARVVLDYFRALRDGETAHGGRIDELAWKDMAVFYRNNALSRVVEDELRNAGVPYVIARGTAFYQREEVKDLLAYLRVTANPADEVSLLRVINKPSRKVGKASLTRLEAYAAQKGLTLFEALKDAHDVDGVSKMAAGGMKRFASMVDEWNGAGSFMGTSVSGSLAELVERILEDSGLEKHFVTQAAKTQREDDESKVDNLREMVSSAADFEEEFDLDDDPGMGPSVDELRAQREALAKALDLDPEDIDDADLGAPPPPTPQKKDPPLLGLLRAYLERVSLVADADQVDPQSGAVTLMTLHAAKGLEFPAVAMIGLEEGLLPSIRSFESDENQEEERRLAFVGITRAMRHLMITSARYRTMRGVRERTIPSSFLKELPEEGVVVSDQAGDDDFVRPRREKREPEAWEDYDFDQRDPTEVRASKSSRHADGLEVGVRVRHPQFGTGRVAALSGFGVNRRARIEFEDVGAKTLILAYARLSVDG
ncbi:MAG: UvrD-helicase domain-containing protein [Phycisphaerales bacterium]